MPKGSNSRHPIEHRALLWAKVVTEYQVITLLKDLSVAISHEDRTTVQSSPTVSKEWSLEPSCS
jgi:hypothetical protein